jgi:hypothetical protein
MALPLLMLPWETRVVVRTFKRGFGATAREVSARTEPRSVTTADILHQAVAELCGVLKLTHSA